MRKEHPDFKSYGEADVMLLAKHFFSNDVDQLMAEWHRFKFDLVDFQGNMDFSLRQLCQSQKQYPLLSEVAEICYSAPVTNAWPERGVSAVKRIKTRLRSLLKDDMLNVLLQVSINGPTLAEADSIIQDATKTWLNDKSRYNLKRVNQPRQPSKENMEPPSAAFFSAATQTDVVIDLNKEAEEEQHSKEQEAESLGLASEDCTEESISDEDSGLDSVSEDEF
ncbi:zinc finger protein 862-like isoform X2 [Montipora foliosa]|uniref:zinc finger protein 862-like isoform X2 n=1 Tax=Montipora foliosa TaxID=591990 RepID=UPI0035F18EFF